MSTTAAHIATHAALAECLADIEVAALRAQFLANNEFIAVTDGLDAAAMAPLLAALPSLEAHVHRTFIPGHKKGGSISRFDLDHYAPAYTDFYSAPELLDFLRKLSGNDLKLCPENDPHGYALYYYTEAGDHVGYHFDTSYYKGQRYTVLIGLVDDSSCRLEYELFHDDPERAPVSGAVALMPGTAVIFNGDKLWHRVTPSALGERRVALTLEYVTSHEMHPVRRFLSNMKDAIAYFGFRQVFSRALRR